MAFKAPGGNSRVKCNPAKGCRPVPQIIKSVNSEPGIPPPPPPPPTPSVTPTPIPPSPSATPIPTPSVTPSPSFPYSNPLIFIVESTFSVPTINLGLMNEGTYSGIIDWGDGNITSMSGAIDGLHTYAVANTYEVKVYGTIIGLEIGALIQSQRQRFKEVKQWGTLQAYNNSFNNMFGYCPQLRLSGVTDILNLQGVTATSYMFGSTNSDNNTLTTINRIGEWDMSSVITMERMFSRINGFNDDITSWNVSAATNMSGLFFGNDVFDRDISGWNVSNVTNMNSMFTDAFAFNQDLSSWCVTSIPSIPTGFDTGASSWVLPRPVWGTCPP